MCVCVCVCVCVQTWTSIFWGTRHPKFVTRALDRTITLFRALVLLTLFFKLVTITLFGFFVHSRGSALLDVQPGAQLCMGASLFGCCTDLGADSQVRSWPKTTLNLGLLPQNDEVINFLMNFGHICRKWQPKFGFLQTFLGTSAKCRLDLKDFSKILFS